MGVKLISMYSIKLKFSKTSDSLEGCIAVLDYNCGQGWLRALRLGASAIIFTRESQPQGINFHYTETNANLLRFYHDGPENELPPDGTTVTLKSKVIWQAATAQNVIAFFRGTAPMFSQGKEEIMVLAANLDTFGEVARRALRRQLCRPARSCGGHLPKPPAPSHAGCLP